MAEASPTPDDFPGRVAAHAKQPPQDGSEPPTEHAMTSLQRADAQTSSRPDHGYPHEGPRNENPVHEQGAKQDASGPTNTAKT